jgi:hypothetical protein
MEAYLKKSGGTMTGDLILEKIKFYDNTLQSTAFTSILKTDVNNNTQKI